MIKVTVAFDTQNETWNIMQGENCLFYGTVWQAEEWLEQHKETHEEAL